MKTTVAYEAPRILDRVPLEQENPILSGSVTDALNLGGVDTMGQEVESIDLEDENFFKHEWL